jgi:hypothetical protein
MARYDGRRSNLAKSHSIVSLSGGCRQHEKKLGKETFNGGGFLDRKKSGPVVEK